MDINNPKKDCGCGIFNNCLCSVTKKGDMEKYLAMKEDPETAYIKHCQQQERKRLFQEVALRTIYWSKYCDDFAWSMNKACDITEAILQASEDFAKELE